jgi:hypothetical protein
MTRPEINWRLFRQWRGAGAEGGWIIEPDPHHSSTSYKLREPVMHVPHLILVIALNGDNPPG